MPLCLGKEEKKPVSLETVAPLETGFPISRLDKSTRHALSNMHRTWHIHLLPCLHTNDTVICRRHCDVVTTMDCWKGCSPRAAFKKQEEPPLPPVVFPKGEVEILERKPVSLETVAPLETGFPISRLDKSTRHALSNMHRTWHIHLLPCSHTNDTVICRRHCDVVTTMDCWKGCFPRAAFKKQEEPPLPPV